MDSMLEGAYVRLEPLAMSHHEGLCAVGLDARLWEFALNSVTDPAGMAAYIEDALRSREEGSAVPYAIIERTSARVVGSTRFGNMSREHRRVEIGWTWLGVRSQRTAMNTETKLLMLRYAFEGWHMNRVEFKTDSLNWKSRNALLRIGAQEEGVLRKHMATDRGRYRNTVYYSILAVEWPEIRARLEQMLRRD